jgi:ATP-dependent Clp protease adaptor protein ClpS
MNRVKTEEEKQTRAKDVENSIVLFNDDHNDFAFVIACLIKYCKHTPMQAEQCALITHGVGKCAVKNGSLGELFPINVALQESGLTSEIQ